MGREGRNVKIRCAFSASLKRKIERQVARRLGGQGESEYQRERARLESIGRQRLWRRQSKRRKGRPSRYRPKTSPRCRLKKHSPSSSRSCARSRVASRSSRRRLPLTNVARPYAGIARQNLPK